MLPARQLISFRLVPLGLGLILAVLSGTAASASAAGLTVTCRPVSPGCSITTGSTIVVRAEVDPQLQSPNVVGQFQWDLDGRLDTGDDGFEEIGDDELQLPYVGERSHRYDLAASYTVRVRWVDLQAGPTPQVVATGQVIVTASGGPTPTPSATPGPGSTPTPTPAPTNPPGQEPPAANPLLSTNLTALTQAATPDRPLVVQAATQASATVVNYQWDTDDNPATFEFSTGRSPQLTLYHQPTGGSVGVRVSDAAGRTSTARVNVARLAVPGCLDTNDLLRSLFKLSGACVELIDNKVVVSPGADATLELSGLVVRIGEAGRPGKLIFDFDGGKATVDAPVTVGFNNLPSGELILYRGDAGIKLFDLPRTTRIAEIESALRRGLRLFTVGAGSGCRPAERTFCARLPGGFPLSGSLSLFVTVSKTLRFEGLVSMQEPLAGTAQIDFTASPEQGLVLDGLDVQIPNRPLGFMTISNARLKYTAPDADRPAEGGTWFVGAKVELPTPQRSSVEGQIEWNNTGLIGALLRIDGLAIPIGPGVTLNRLGASVFTRPSFRAGGDIGIAFAGTAQVNASFEYRVLAALTRLHVEGDVSIVGQKLASAEVNYWSNGNFDFAGSLLFTIPRGQTYDDAFIGVEGGVNGWVVRDRFQVEGRVRVHAWIIRAGIQGLVNNDWFAGCANVFLFDARVAVSTTDGHLEAGLDCNLGPYRLVAPPSGARATRSRLAAPAPRSFQVPGGLRGVNVLVTGKTGAPSIKVVGPGGAVVADGTTSASGTPFGTKTRGGVRDDATKLTVVRIAVPAAGTYSVQSAEGSSELESIKVAQELGDPNVKASIQTTGAVQRLTMSGVAAPGRVVRVFEDGADTNNPLATFIGSRSGWRAVAGMGGARAEAAAAGPRDVAWSASAARATEQDAASIVITPAEGAPKRALRAEVTQDGQPVESEKVGSYTAKVPKLVKPAGLTVTRKGAIRWKKVGGAARYLVEVKGTDGRNAVEYVTATKATTRAPLVFQSLTVKVRAISPAGVQGPVATARSKAPAKTDPAKSTAPTKKGGK